MGESAAALQLRRSERYWSLQQASRRPRVTRGNPLSAATPPPRGRTPPARSGTARKQRTRLPSLPGRRPPLLLFQNRRHRLQPSQFRRRCSRRSKLRPPPRLPRPAPPHQHRPGPRSRYRRRRRRWYPPLLQPTFPCLPSPLGPNNPRPGVLPLPPPPRNHRRRARLQLGPRCRQVHPVCSPPLEPGPAQQRPGSPLRANPALATRPREQQLFRELLPVNRMRTDRKLPRLSCRRRRPERRLPPLQSDRPDTLRVRQASRGAAGKTLHLSQAHRPGCTAERSGSAWGWWA